MNLKKKCREENWKKRFEAGGGYDVLIGGICFFEIICFQLGRKRNSEIFSKIILPWKKRVQKEWQTIFFAIICKEGSSSTWGNIFSKNSKSVSHAFKFRPLFKKNSKEKSQNLVTTFWKINLNGNLFWWYRPSKNSKTFFRKSVSWKSDPDILGKN